MSLAPPIGFDMLLTGLVTVAIVGLSLVVVGPDSFRALTGTWRGRLRSVSTALLVLFSTVGLKHAVRPVSADLSWLIGWNVTGYIYALEGNVVPAIQSIATPGLTAYLAFMYLAGFSVLLVFPFVAYFTLDDPEPFRATAVAFSVNYLVGLLGYVLFIAYGPRNFLPELVDPLLYTSVPRAHFLTAQVSRNTNVFPSLHTSFSVTVALLAWRTRDRFPRWTAVAVPTAASIVFATMYLGIHWLTDVVAGVALAWASVRVADRQPFAGVDPRLGARLSSLVARGGRNG